MEAHLALAADLATALVGRTEAHSASVAHIASALVGMTMAASLAARASLGGEDGSSLGISPDLTGRTAAATASAVAHLTFLVSN